MSEPAVQYRHPPRRSLARFVERTADWESYLSVVRRSMHNTDSLGVSSPRSSQFVVASGPHFAGLVEDMHTTLGDSRIAVTIDPNGSPSPHQHIANMTNRNRRGLGQTALEVFFGQLFLSDGALLDLRITRFRFDGNAPATWSPQPYHVKWEPEFLEGLRHFYAGLFMEDDERVRRGLQSLRLIAAADLMMNHFGTGGRRSVRFDEHALAETLREAAARCSNAGVQPHPNLVPFGMYLASVNDLLAALGRPYDVQSAFRRVFRYA